MDWTYQPILINCHRLVINWNTNLFHQHEQWTCIPLSQKFRVFLKKTQFFLCLPLVSESLTRWNTELSEKKESYPLKSSSSNETITCKCAVIKQVLIDKVKLRCSFCVWMIMKLSQDVTVSLWPSLYKTMLSTINVSIFHISM